MVWDIWADDLYEAEFGGLRLDVQLTQDAGGRVLVGFESPGRDGAEIRDQGGEPRVTQTKCIFLKLSAADDPMARFRAFEAMKRSGETRKFVHPITGPYMAKIGQFNWSAEAEARGMVAVDVTFHEDTAQPSIFGPGAGTESLSGLEDVRVSVAAVDDGLVEIEAETGVVLTTTVHTDAFDLAESWDQSPTDSLTERDVKLALADMTNRIESETERLELATEIDRYPIIVAFTRLQHSLRKAADAIVTDSPRIVEWRPLAPMSLFAYCQRTYGAADAEARADQIERLNDIRTPHRIEPGVVLRVPSASSPPRFRSPR